MSLNIDRSTWTSVALGDVARLSSEKTDPVADGVERYVAGEHMDTDELRISRWGIVGEGYLGPAFHRRFQAGQILYGSRRTYLRKVALAHFDGVCANTTFVIESRDQTRLLPLLLPFIMSTERFHAHSIAESKGSVNPYVNWPDIAKYKFELPPLDQQQELAELLWAAEHHCRAQLEARARLKDFHAFQFRHLLAASQAREFEVASLLLEPPRNGLSLPAQDSGHGYPTVSISAVREGRFIVEGNLKWVDVDIERIRRFIVEPNDFFVVRGNGNRNLVARGALVTQEELPEHLFYPDLLIRLRFDASLILPEFAALLWNAEASHRRLLSVAKTTNGTFKVNGKDVRNHVLEVPSLSEQKSILQQMGIIEEAQAQIQASISATRRITRALLDELSAGQP